MRQRCSCPTWWQTGPLEDAATGSILLEYLWMGGPLCLMVCPSLDSLPAITFGRLWMCQVLSHLCLVHQVRILHKRAQRGSDSIPPLYRKPPWVATTATLFKQRFWNSLGPKGHLKFQILKCNLLRKGPGSPCSVFP